MRHSTIVKVYKAKSVILIIRPHFVFLGAWRAMQPCYYEENEFQQSSVS